MRFCKYHGLGNDYIVINPKDAGNGLSESQIQRICHRNFGVGSDGILFGPIKPEQCDLGVRIFNPDGSEAEKSGNGLRIFSRYLWDLKLVDENPFKIWTEGGIVESCVHNNGADVSVEMGRVSFVSSDIPVAGEKREVINEEIDPGGKKYFFCGAGIGNPHCVIVKDEISDTEAKKWGPSLETHSLFPNKTNVQFMKIVNRSNVQLEIWERGAGYTLASGSSASASAAVAKKLELCDSEITVHMPGGNLDIIVADDFSISMSGPVVKIAAGELAPEIFK